MVYLIFHPDTKIEDLVKIGIYNIVAFVLIIPPLYFLNQKKNKLFFFTKLLKEKGYENWYTIFAKDYTKDKDQLTTSEYRYLGQEIYIYFFRKFLEDFELAPAELEELEKIQQFFSLETEFLEKVKNTHGKKVLEQLSKIAYEDLVLTPEEEAKIYCLAEALQISKADVKNLKKNVALEKMDSAIKVVLEDNQYTDEELKQIQEIRTKLNLSEEELNLKGIQKQLDYFRKIYLIEKGEIPVIESSISFSEKEKIYWEKEAVRLEFNPTEKFLENRGFIVKVTRAEEFQIGKSRKQILEATGKGRFEGKLFITSQRIIFVQKIRPFFLKYEDLVEMEIFRNGVCLYDTKKNSALLEFPNEDEMFPFLVSKLWKK
jgi:hypothetical protein